MCSPTDLIPVYPIPMSCKHYNKRKKKSSNSKQSSVFPIFLSVPLHTAIFFWFVEAPLNKAGNKITFILFPSWKKMLSRSIHIAKVVTFNISEVHNHYTGEDFYLYSCSWAPLSAPDVPVCIVCTTNAWGNTLAIAHSSALGWSFARRCRLATSCCSRST